MFAYLLPLLNRLRNNDQGVTAMEYGVIAAGTVVAISAAMLAIGPELTGVFNQIKGALPAVG